MASANYVLLERITVGAAGASSVTFSSIPQTGYTDLVVKMTCRFDLPYDAANLNIRFNGDSAANYSTRRLKGTGSAAISDNTSAATTMVFNYGAGDTLTANTFSNGEMYIPNYTSANYKSVSSDVVTENNATAAYTVLQAGLWSNTAAITSIVIACDGNWKANSTFYLYGVAKLGTTPAIVPYATGGDTIMTDGTYWYHAFLSSGTFTPQKALSCDYLVVAGGGGGSYSDGAGGGAGGYRTSIGGSALSLGTSAYTVTIGAGGAGGTSGNGSSGSNSVFATITSSGGGYGGVYDTNGGSGGSGGGGGYGTGVGGAGNAGSYSPVEGYAGGNGAANSGGGGGGSSAVGGVGTYSVRANGGNGTANSISGTSVTYAGGGGAGTSSSGVTPGTGGTGGGGGGGTRAGINGVAGTTNTGGGGGGGGGSTTSNGGAGGSGLVIVRYAV